MCDDMGCICRVEVVPPKKPRRKPTRAINRWQDALWTLEKNERWVFVHFCFGVECVLHDNEHLFSERGSRDVSLKVIRNEILHKRGRDKYMQIMKAWIRRRIHQFIFVLNMEIAENRQRGRSAKTRSLTRTCWKKSDLRKKKKNRKQSWL